MKWEAEEKGYDCNDCYLSMQNCHDMSICCEDESGPCDCFEEMPDKEENRMDIQRVIDILATEKECVERAGTGTPNKACDRNCADCVLLLDDTEILQAYDEAIGTLKRQRPDDA